MIPGWRSEQGYASGSCHKICTVLGLAQGREVVDCKGHFGSFEESTYLMLAVFAAKPSLWILAGIYLHFWI